MKLLCQTLFLFFSQGLVRRRSSQRKPGTPNKRRRCYLCPRARDRKSVIVCVTCGFNICREHRDPNNTLYKQCLCCAGLPVPEPDSPFSSLSASSYNLPTMVSISSGSMKTGKAQQVEEVTQDSVSMLRAALSGETASDSDPKPFYVVSTEAPIESDGLLQQGLVHLADTKPLSGDETALISIDPPDDEGSIESKIKKEVDMN